MIWCFTIYAVSDHYHLPEALVFHEAILLIYKDILSFRVAERETRVGWKKTVPRIGPPRLEATTHHFDKAQDTG